MESMKAYLKSKKGKQFVALSFGITTVVLLVLLGILVSANKGSNSSNNTSTLPDSYAIERTRDKVNIESSFENLAESGTKIVNNLDLIEDQLSNIEEPQKEEPKPERNTKTFYLSNRPDDPQGSHKASFEASLPTTFELMQVSDYEAVLYTPVIELRFIVWLNIDSDDYPVAKKGSEVSVVGNPNLYFKSLVRFKGDITDSYYYNTADQDTQCNNGADTCISPVVGTDRSLYEIKCTVVNPSDVSVCDQIMKSIEFSY